MQLFGKMRSSGLEDTIAMAILMFRVKKWQNLKETLLPSSKQLNNMELILLVWLVLRLAIQLTMPTLPNKMEIPQLCNFLLSKCFSPKPYSIKLNIEMALLITKMSNILMLFLKIRSKIKLTKLKKPINKWFIEMLSNLDFMNLQVSKTFIC